MWCDVLSCVCIYLCVCGLMDGGALEKGREERKENLPVSMPVCVFLHDPLNRVG